MLKGDGYNDEKITFQLKIARARSTNLDTVEIGIWNIIYPPDIHSIKLHLSIHCEEIKYSLNNLQGKISESKNYCAETGFLNKHLDNLQSLTFKFALHFKNIKYY